MTKLIHSLFLFLSLSGISLAAANEPAVFQRVRDVLDGNIRRGCGMCLDMTKDLVGEPRVKSPDHATLALDIHDELVCSLSLSFFLSFFAFLSQLRDKKADILL